MSYSTTTDDHPQKTFCRDPVVHLPPEIAGNVLLLCELKGEGEGRVRPRTPLSLSHVCHQWRHLAHSVPLLWTDLELYKVHRTSMKHLVLIRSWLDRSKSLPISITLSNYTVSDHEEFEDWPDEFELERTIAVISTVIMYSERWIYLNAELFPQCFAPTLWNEACGRLNSLQHLLFCTNDVGEDFRDDEANDAKEFSALFLSAPKLQMLDLWGESFQVLHPRLKNGINWGKLSKVNVAVASQTDLAHVLQHCSAVNTMTLYNSCKISQDWSKDAVTYTSGCLEHLKSLELTFDDCPDEAVEETF